MLKSKKVCKFLVQECLKILILVFKRFEMYQNFKKDQFLGGKTKTLFINNAQTQLEQRLF